MKKAAVLFIAALLFVSILGCGDGGSSSISGTWKHDGNGTVYEFKSDGVLIITLPGGKSFEGTYETDESFVSLSAVINDIPSEQTGHYVIEGDKMTITSPDTGAVVTFTKQ
ncbi:DUF5640 domain-containing protein [Eubacteriales bacterium OttesenSCG-928-N14]|nr:DUF5640 domain-containing protein [Eubacteriales bacterium OttesenSCG-928-N14]